MPRLFDEVHLNDVDAELRDLVFEMEDSELVRTDSSCQGHPEDAEEHKPYKLWVGFYIRRGADRLVREWIDNVGRAGITINFVSNSQRAKMLSPHTFVVYYYTIEERTQAIRTLRKELREIQLR